LLQVSNPHSRNKKKNPRDYPVASQQRLDRGNNRGEQKTISIPVVGNSLLEMTGTAVLATATHSPEGWQSKTDGVDLGDNSLNQELKTQETPVGLSRQPLSKGQLSVDIPNPPDRILNQVRNDNLGSDSIPNPQQIQTIIHAFTKSPLCVMMFKILIPQIIVEKILDDVITVSLTAPTFVSQLENSKNQKLILDHIFEYTNVAYKLELTTRSINNTPLKDHRTEKEILEGKQQAEDKNNRYEAPKPSYGKKYEGPTRQVAQTEPKNEDSEILEKYSSKSIEPEAKTNSNKPSTKPNEKYFYSVYQGLPVNTVGEDSIKSQVPVRLESIPFPVKAEIIMDQNMNWSTEIEEIFDF
jgi:hypothetical protein